MSGFPADWLDLREPHDFAARDPDLLDRLAAWAQERGRLRVVDLGSGTGSNLRATAATLGVPQDWTLIEHDTALIEAGRRRLEGVDRIAWRYREADLAAPAAAWLPEDVELVTASALIDLVSAAWLERLVAAVAARGAALHVVLTYDGRWRWRPGDIFDADALRLFNAHQRADKGLGPALGGEAAGRLETLLTPLAGTVHTGRSDWRLEPEDRAIQTALLAGYAEAALAKAPEEAEEIRGWQAQRQRQIERGRSRHIVGHHDLLYLPHPD